VTSTPVGVSPPRRLPLLALIGAHGLSQFGNVLTSIALPWFVLETTGSPAKTGMTLFFGIAPTLLLLTACCGHATLWLVLSVSLSGLATGHARPGEPGTA
jgi:hypothetical protein